MVRVPPIGRKAFTADLFISLLYQTHPSIHKVVNELLDFQVDMYTKINSVSRKIPSRASFRDEYIAKAVNSAYVTLIQAGGIDNK